MTATENQEATTEETKPTTTPTTETNAATSSASAGTALATTEQQPQPPARREGSTNPLWSLPVSAMSKLQELPMVALYGLSRQLAASDLVPERLIGKPDNVFMVLLKGAELNVSVSTALAEIMIVEGKLTISSHLQNALVQRSGKMKIWRIVETTDERAVMEVQRHDWSAPTSVMFTAEEAEKLGLTKRGKNPAFSPWNTQRANMLRRRVITRAARECAGDVVIAYDPEELEHDDDYQAAPPALWGKAPAITMPVPASELPEPEPDPDFGSPSFEKLEPKPADFANAISQFVTEAGRAKDRRTLDDAQRLLQPLYEAADRGDVDAQTALRDAEVAYERNSRRIAADATTKKNQQRQG